MIKAALFKLINIEFDEKVSRRVVEKHETKCFCTQKIFSSSRRNGRRDKQIPAASDSLRLLI